MLLDEIRNAKEIVVGCGRRLKQWKETVPGSVC